MRAAALAALAVFAATGCGDGSHASVYTDMTGWSVTVPSGMRVERSHSARGLELQASEATFATFRPGLGIKPYLRGHEAGFTWGEPHNARGRFPDAAVAFRVWREEGGPAVLQHPRDTHFPIRLADFRASADFRDERPQPLEYAISSGGRTFLVYAWIGSRASQDRRSDLRRLVASLTAPS